MPTTARSIRTMICTTAKSTDVNSRRTTRPIRSKTSGGEAGPSAAGSAHVVTGLAIALVLSRSWSPRSGSGGLGGCGLDALGGRAGSPFRGGPSGLEGPVEVRDQVVGVLEPDRGPEEPRGDPGRRELVVGQLAVGRRRR